MNESKVDAARLAALLDGRLSADERAKVLAAVASSDEAYEVLVDAITVLPEVSGDPRSTGRETDEARPRDRRGRWHMRSGRWLALAAAVVVLAVLPWLWNTGRPTNPHDPARFVALLDVQPVGLPSTWDSRPWASTRGAGDPLTGPSRAARVGAHLVDLELAVRTRDTRAGPLAAEIAALLEGVPAGSPAAAIYRNVSRRAGSPRDSLARLLERGRVAASELAGEDLVALGAWAETARLAAASHDIRFFHNDATGDMLSRAAQLPDLAPAARALLGRLRPAAGPGAPDWPSLERDLTAVLAALAG